MNVAYITMQFPVPSETFASLDIESLRQQGQDVSVYCMRPKHVQFENLMVDRGHTRLKVTHFSFVSIIVFFTFLLRHPFMTLSLLGWVFFCCAKTPKHFFKSLVLFPSALSIFSSVLKEKPDVVHLFWGHYPSMVGYLVKKYMTNTVVSMFLGAHDLVSAYPGSVRLSEDADVVVTHSKSNLPMMAELGINVNQVNVVVRGTKLDFPVEGVDNKFKELNEPFFLTAARLIEEKGVDDVLRIFKGILNHYPRAFLYIAGDGPFRLKLEKMVSNLGLQRNVSFLGHVNQVELIKVMSKTHFFLLMSRYPSERLPNVVKEAMYQECVVVTTKTHGIDELIDHGVDGFIVEKGDWENGLDSVNTCLVDEVSAHSISVNAKQKVIDKFDVNISMNTYINFWQVAKDRNGLL
ncbi:MAG: glycosyltransferase [Methyloprofundus sp.]|nr:glycosyltransferase [Methyloprofundus sp.]